MSIQDIFEEGDTGEAILPVPVSAIAARARANSSTSVEVDKVSDKGVHADRDGSEAREARLAPRTETPSTRNARDRDAEGSVSAYEYETADESTLRNALAWLTGYRPELAAQAFRRARGDWS